MWASRPVTPAQAGLVSPSLLSFSHPFPSSHNLVPLLLNGPPLPYTSSAASLAFPASSSRCPCHNPAQEPATTPSPFLDIT